MTNQATSNIIFTKDEAYAYKLRTKLNNVNVRADYIRDTEGLLFYMFTNEKGIILIDLKYARFLKLITEYCKHPSSRNFCFVFLNDNRDREVNFDNKLIFVTNYENLVQTVALAHQSLEKIEKRKSSIPKDYIDGELTKRLSEFQISTKYIGYDLIKDSIKILANKPSRDFLCMKSVYEEVAEIHGKEPCNVEKSIRLALKKAQNANPEIFQKTFNSSNISNTALLYYLSEQIKVSFHKAS